MGWRCFRSLQLHHCFPGCWGLQHFAFCQAQDWKVSREKKLVSEQSRNRHAFLAGEMSLACLCYHHETTGNARDSQKNYMSFYLHVDSLKTSCQCMPGWFRIFLTAFQIMFLLGWPPAYCHIVFCHAILLCISLYISGSWYSSMHCRQSLKINLAKPADLLKVQQGLGVHHFTNMLFG